MSSANKPIGVRLNNPGNLEWGSPWQGLVPRSQSMYANTGTQQQKRFCQFKDVASGIRAIAVTLITYQDKRRAKDGSRIDSAKEIIERWAPAVENNVTAYAKALAVALGKAPDDETVDVHDYATLRTLVEAIIRHENGPIGPHKTLNTWYTEAQIAEGLRRAGAPAPAPISALPVNKETVSAATVGIAGAADALTAVGQAVQDNQDNMASGSVMRVVIGVLLVGIAVFVAYSQYKKRQAGSV